ncbi:hypothetical protein K08M3_51710 [Vibrio alginolyticus]|uniref:hypothetical protein n=1 Tax=Vibrio alginolyticus TaxID=663 RepID=UPI000A28EF34|nr:hypothetical protein [Vibrio alginolyticus]ARP36779.1 hypothetical protein K08M3_51710 [Vibrio alginolyticus]
MSIFGLKKGRLKSQVISYATQYLFTSDKKPVRLWTLVHFRNQAIVPPANLPLVHRDTAILEDISHDWSIRQGHLIYRGQYAEGGIWLAVEFDS